MNWELITEWLNDFAGACLPEGYDWELFLYSGMPVHSVGEGGYRATWRASKEGYGFYFYNQRFDKELLEEISNPRCPGDTCCFCNGAVWCGCDIPCGRTCKAK